VPVESGPTLSIGPSRMLSSTRAHVLDGDGGRAYDVSRDGNRFLMIKSMLATDD